MTETSECLAPLSGAALPFSHEEVERSLPERFARIATANPSGLAIAAGSARVTYAQLDHQSNALAAAIAARAPGSGAIAVLTGDVASMVIAILAVWKLGKLCVPLDCNYPPARIDLVLRDAEAELVVADRDGSARIAALTSVPAARPLCLDDVDFDRHVAGPHAAVPADSPACLIYTSGSTGEPKGVLQSHRSILHRARGLARSFETRFADRIGSLHPPGSALGLREMLAALFSGATLLPFDLRGAGLRGLTDWIEREQVTILYTVVSTLRHLLAHLDGGNARLGSVRIVRVGSEPLYGREVEKFRRLFSRGCLLIAGYGTTEATGIAERHIRLDTALPRGRVAAGYALEGIEVLVLDEDGRRVDSGKTGEVAIRSRYLAEGYWRRPELTRKVFRTDPLDPSKRVYFTGDFGRLCPDGCLELLGRRDHQIKVRGYRVHSGEVEAALSEHEGIRDTVVMGWAEAEEDENRLVAYVMPAISPAPAPSELRRFLQARLPTYMVPAAFVSLDALPIAASGKVDRAALPPPPKAAARQADFVRPRSPLEHQLAAIYEEIFGVSPVGAKDDFFDLGGDSLLATALMAAIEETCGLAAPPSVLLEASTVEKLAWKLIHGDAFDEPVTGLRESGTGTPFFFVHNDHGRGLYTHAVARHVDVDRPFYAVHLHGLAGRALPPTVEAIAADRNQALRAARPHGPYALGGHCFGGFVALEMARQLRAQGERVEVVVLVDTRAPSRGLRALRRLTNGLGWQYGMPPFGRPELFSRGERLSGEIARTLRYYRSRARVLARAGFRAQADVMLGKLGLIAGNAAVSAPPAQQVEARYPTLAPGGHWDLYRRAIRRYVPTPYDERVVLLRTEEVRAETPHLGWSALLPHLELAMVPGDHHTSITRHVADFGARLNEILGNARAALDSAR